MANRKTINLTARQRKSFNINLSYFDFAFTFIVRILLGINLSFLISMTTKIQQTFILKKIRVIVNSFRMTTKRSQTFILKRAVLLILMKLSKKFSSTIILKNTILEFLMRTSMKVSNTVILKKIVLSWVLLKVILNKLSAYDLQPLSDLDPESLGTLDYLILP
jgi:hypothetical protein